MAGKTNQHLALILLAVLIILCILPFSASAQIVNWSTNGSSASSQKDQMFMVNEFENVFFNVSVTEKSDYKWYVNKILTKSDNLNYLSSNYTFSVPLKNNLDISDNIWEISVISINGNEEHCHEWVITVLNQSEAPDIFDFFSDKKYKTRTITDPWENSLPEWIELSGNNKDFDISNGFLYLNRTAPSQISAIYTNSSMKYGTWIFWERANATGVTKPQISRTVTVLSNATIGGYGHYHSFDGHNYFDAPLGDGSVKTTLYEYMSQAGVGEHHADTPVWEDSSWNEFKIIHEQDGNWYLFKNDILIEQSYEKSDLITSDRIAIIEGLNVANDDPAIGEWFEIDMLQAYEDEYLFPEQNITYDNYILDLWSGYKGPYYFDAIRIVGRDITLADINDSINNQSLFTYDDTTKTATSHTNIYLESGASMLIENSVLYMNTSTGIKIFNVRNGAKLVINNSRIDTTSDTLFRWQFPSALDAIITDFGLIKKFNGIIEIRNSVLNNTAYFNIHSGDRTIIEDTIISNVSTYNQHGNSIYSMSFINWFKTENFTFNNITITSKTDEIDLKFIDGDAFGEVNIYDSDLSNVNLDVSYSTSDIGRAEPHTRTVNVINTLYSSITQTSNTYLTPWYYLDVYVESLTGNPVSNAEIQISNSVGNKNPRNLYEYTKWTSSLDEGYNRHDIGLLKWETTDISNTATASDGHSPLPSNKMSTVILPDYKQYKDNEVVSRTNYTYDATITTINGSIILSEIASGPWWYRPNPEIPTYTIVVVTPNESTTIPSLIGYAPSEDNPITPGKTIMFQTWTNQPMTTNTWKLDGTTVETGSQSWLWENIPEGEHTVVYEGSNANGAVSQTWNINGDFTQEGLSITEFFPVDTTPDQNNGSTYEFTVAVNEPLTSSNWYLDNDPDPIDSNSLSLDHTWTHASTHNITFTGSNANGSVSKTWTVNVNDAPVLAAIGSRSTDEGSILEITLTATDNDPLTYSATGLPTGATFNPTTRAFSWTPDENQAGSYQVHFEVTDGSLSDAEDVTITVNSVNHTINKDPILPEYWNYYEGSGSGDWGRTTDEAHSGNYSAFLQGTEYSSDILNIGLVAGDSNGYSGLNAYNATPDTTYNISFWIKGDFNYISVYAMTWNTEDGSSGRALRSTSIGQVTPTGTWIQYQGTFTTPSDAKKLILMFKVYGDSSQINLGTIYVDDVEICSSPNIVQNPGAENLQNDSEPVPNSIVSITPSTTQTTPGETFTLTIPITPATPITGVQFDFLFDNSLATVTSVTEGNLLNQDGATTLFNSGIINNAAGTVTNVYGSILGETSVSSQGSFATISMTAGSTTGYLNLDLTNVKISDADSAAAPYTLTNATILIDTAPMLGSIGAKSVDEGSALTFTTGASDVDGDSLTYTATNLPVGASFNTATGAFSWTPADGEAGTYVVTFEVTDGYIGDSEAVTITVNDANNAPVITTFVPANSLTFNELDVITVGIIATDADGQALSYTIKIDGVTQSTSSSYVWETDYSSAGSHTIDIIVSDGIEQVTDQRTITVNDVRPRWDVNEDGTVNVLDISIIGQKYGASVEAPYPRWDVNQDGVINVQDMTLAGSHFGETVA